MTCNHTWGGRSASGTLVCIKCKAPAPTATRDELRAIVDEVERHAIVVHTLQPGVEPRHLGYIPGFLEPDDKRPAREQFDDRYMGGWRPLKGATLDKDGHTMFFPGDPPQHAFAFINFHNERIVFFPHAWIAIVQKDGSFEIARMD